MAKISIGKRMRWHKLKFAFCPTPAVFAVFAAPLFCGREKLFPIDQHKNSLLIEMLAKSIFVPIAKSLKVLYIAAALATS